MKKIALLFVAVIFVFSLSAVFATEEEPVITTEAPEVEVSNEVENVETLAADVQSGEDEIVENVEIISGEEENTVVEAISGELVEESGEVANTETAETEDTTTTSSNNGSIVGAIIAVVIVIAVVAIAAILRKD